MSKREKMRRRARKELAKRERSTESDGDSIDESKEKKPPTFISGFSMIFFGSLTFAIFFSAGQALLGVLASAAFILIGMSRLAKATAAKNQPETLST